MQLRLIAALGAAIFLAGCQDAQPLPATNEDRAIVAAQLMGDLINRATGSKTGSLMLVPQMSDRKTDELDRPNLLRTNLKFGGHPLKLAPRVPLDALNHIYYAASVSGAGSWGEIFGFSTDTDAAFRPTNFVTMIQRKNSGRPVLGGSIAVSYFTRGEGRVRYGIYTTPEIKGASCVTFIQENRTAFLSGDICLPPGQKMGKARAEAIIRGIGIDPHIPVEPTPDLATLPVD